MRELFAFFRQVNATLWGGSIFQYWFYIAVVLIIILEKRKSVRIIFAWFPIVFYVAIFNPISYKVMSKIFTWDLQAYYCRLFSMMPILYTIVVGTIIILDKFKGAYKLIGVVGVSLLIVFKGINVYSQDWMTDSENIYKIPNTVVTIANYIHDDIPVTIAVPGNLSSYMRQYDASLYTPYGRSVDELGAELAQESPDIDRIIQLSGERDCDYVVALDTDSSKTAFASAGFVPELETGGYALYNMIGIARKDKEYNSQRQIISVTEYDAEGNAVTQDGYATEAYEYDELGNQSVIRYLDENGDPSELSDGTSVIKRQYTYSGLVSEETRFDMQGAPLVLNGYATVCYEYNKDKLITRESYKNESGELVNRTDVPYAIKEYTYDSDKYISSEAYYDSDNKPCVNNAGYHEVCYEYNADRYITRQLYKDESGNLVNREDVCYAIIEWQYDENNHIVSEAYYDKDNAPCISNEGYHVRRIERDDSGRSVEEGYYSIDDEAVLKKAGYAYLKRTYNDQNEIENETYLDTMGKEIDQNSVYWRCLRPDMGGVYKILKGHENTKNKLLITLGDKVRFNGLTLRVNDDSSITVDGDLIGANNCYSIASGNYLSDGEYVYSDGRVSLDSIYLYGESWNVQNDNNIEKTVQLNLPERNRLFCDSDLYNKYWFGFSFGQGLKLEEKTFYPSLISVDEYDLDDSYEPAWQFTNKAVDEDKFSSRLYYQIKEKDYDAFTQQDTDYFSESIRTIYPDYIDRTYLIITETQEGEPLIVKYEVD